MLETQNDDSVEGSGEKFLNKIKTSKSTSKLYGALGKRKRSRTAAEFNQRLINMSGPPEYQAQADDQQQVSGSGSVYPSFTNVNIKSVSTRDLKPPG